LNKVLAKLEKLEQEWRIEGVPEEYKMIWVPNNEIRLWSVPRSTGQLLRALVLTSQPKVTVELGTSAGYSTLWMASAVKEIGGTIYTVEAAKPKFEMASQHFREAGFEDVIVQKEGMASEVLETFEEKINFLFLDADKNNYLKYLKIIEPKLDKGAIIVADNAINYGDNMRDFLEYLEINANYSAQMIEIDYGVMVALKLS
jgi:caffeoyl-CoA O-methyltransferase